MKNNSEVVYNKMATLTCAHTHEMCEAGFEVMV